MPRGKAVFYSMASPFGERDLDDGRRAEQNCWYSRFSEGRQQRSASFFFQSDSGEQTVLALISSAETTGTL